MDQEDIVKPQLAFDREPWERQPGERAHDFALFVRWLHLSPAERKYRAFADVAGRSYSSLQGMASKWSWPERLAAYEAEAERTTLLAVRDTNRRMATELAGVMGHVPQAMNDALTLGMRTIQHYLDAPRELPLNAQDAVRLLTAANTLGLTATRYLETAGELTRKLEVSINGRVQHTHDLPPNSHLHQFVRAMVEGQMWSAEEGEILDAAIIEDEQPAIGPGDDQTT